LRDTLDRSVCRLIMLGHTGAWDYGWSFFLVAIDEAVVSLSPKK
jgi:hypothetical protein